MTKPWKIEYKDEPWATLHEGKEAKGMGFYRLTFEDAHYGFISKEAWDALDTGQILSFVEQMLNDAHNLALRQVDA